MIVRINVGNFGDNPTPNARTISNYITYTQSHKQIALIIVQFMQPIIKTVLKFVYKFNCLNLDILWKSNEKKNKYWKQKIAASLWCVVKLVLKRTVVANANFNFNFSESKCCTETLQLKTQLSQLNEEVARQRKKNYTVLCISSS